MSDTLVIDVETKKSFAEVGGEAFKRDLGVSVAGVYSYRDDAFFALEEHEMGTLEERLKETDEVIGFNIKHFDIPVLEPYFSGGFPERIAVRDLFEDAVRFLGHRVGLNALAKATLGVEKSGHGLEALAWYKEGKIDQIKKYCLDDVRLTRDLYEHGKAKGFVLFQSFIDGRTHSIPVPWSEGAPKSVMQTIAEAFAGRRRLAIEYVSAQNEDQMGFRKERLVDIYGIKKDYIEAYCHLRRAPRNFYIKRITKAELTGESYVIPQDAQGVLL
ncbi:MAG: WYL domain-containing protein [Patescibacteria group bacterium]